MSLDFNDILYALVVFLMFVGFVIGLVIFWRSR